jgi:hypothetical protein
MKLIILVVVRELHRLRAVAIDGSKFRAVASIDSTRDRLALQRYLDSIEKAGEEQQASIDPSAVQSALEKGFPKSVGKVGSRLYGFPPFPYSVISMVCFWC